MATPVTGLVMEKSRKMVSLVAHAVGAVVHHFAVAGEEGDDAGKMLLVYFLLHQRVEALKALGGEAHGLGLDGSEVKFCSGRLLRWGWMGGQGKDDCGQRDAGDDCDSMDGHGIPSWSGAENERRFCRTLYTKNREARQTGARRSFYTI